MPLAGERETGNARPREAAPESRHDPARLGGPAQRLPFVGLGVREVEEGEGEVRLVLEEGEDLRLPVLPGPEEAPFAVAHPRRAGTARRRAPRRGSAARRGSTRPRRGPRPPARSSPRSACRRSRAGRAAAASRGAVRGRRASRTSSSGRGLVAEVEDVHPRGSPRRLVVEVPLGPDAVGAREERRVVAGRLADLRLGPDEVPPLLALRVGVRGGEETPLPRHASPRGASLRCRAPSSSRGPGPSGRTPARRARGAARCRSASSRSEGGATARRWSSGGSRRRGGRGCRRGPSRRASSAPSTARSESPSAAFRRSHSSARCGGNFGAPPKPPCRASNVRFSVAVRTFPVAADERLAARPLRDPVRALHLGDDLVGPLRQLVAPLAPRLGELLEDRAEPRAAVAVLGREVGAAEERAAVGKEERREGPAAPARPSSGPRSCRRRRRRAAPRGRPSPRRSARSGRPRPPRSRTTRAP